MFALTVALVCFLECEKFGLHELTGIHLVTFEEGFQIDRKKEKEKMIVELFPLLGTLSVQCSGYCGGCFHAALPLGTTVVANTHCICRYTSEWFGMVLREESCHINKTKSCVYYDFFQPKYEVR